MRPGRGWPERFWTKVDKSDACWIWRGATTKPENGYGQIRLDGKMQVAHRIAYELEVGQIPSGMDLDHLCRVRLCVNPAHLEPVSPYENFRRGVSQPASYLKQSHCKRGHLLEGENLAIANGGRSRRCRTCKRDNERMRRAISNRAASSSGEVRPQG